MSVADIASNWAATAIASALLLACGADRDGEPAGTEAESADDSDESTGTDSAGLDEPEILSAYYGLDMLPMGAALLCGTPAVVGEDGMPVTFSTQLLTSSVQPSAFEVETATGDLVTPTCATLNPAVEALELRTVLLTGTFGTPDAPPVAVRVVGDLESLAGESLETLSTNTVTPLEAGPSLVWAERFAPDMPGLEDECPSDTVQIVQMVWEGGVSGPGGVALGEPQRTGVQITLQDGTSVEPTALGDDDPDNFVAACVAEASPAVQITVDAGLFHDPGDDPNPQTSILVNP